MGRSAARTRAAELIASLDLDGVADRTVSTLSLNLTGRSLREGGTAATAGTGPATRELEVAA